MAGVSNAPIAHQLKTTRPLMTPPPYRPETLTTPRAPTPPSALRRPNNTTQPNQNQYSVHYATITEPLDEISIDELHDTVEALTQPPSDHNSNDNTNTVDSTYLGCTYFCANLAITHTNNSHDISSATKTLVDSGASHSMFNTKELFTNLTIWKDTTRSVQLADGKSKASIIGSRTVQGKTSGGDTLTIENCLYVPQLNYSLLSTKSFAGPSGFPTHTAKYTTTIRTPHIRI